MTDILTTLMRIRRHPRHIRIAILRAEIEASPPRSVRAIELTAALKREVLAQLRAENREAKKRA